MTCYNGDLTVLTQLHIYECFTGELNVSSERLLWFQCTDEKAVIPREYVRRCPITMFQPLRH
jgi:hypothetical protein